MTGRLLYERLGRVHFLLFFVGFTLTFVPQYILGSQGMPRRIADYAADHGWTELNPLSTVGALLLAPGAAVPGGRVLALRRPARPSRRDPWGGDRSSGRRLAAAAPQLPRCRRSARSDPCTTRASRRSDPDAAHARRRLGADPGGSAGSEDAS